MVREDGTSTVEIAILSPLFVALLLASIWAGDVSIARLKQRQALRYLTWEATAFAFSDEEAAEHEARFQEAKRSILAEGGARWRTLQGDESRSGPVGLLAEARLGDIQWERTAFEPNRKLEGPTGGKGLSSVVAIVSEFIGRFAGLQEPVLRHMGFNLDHTGVAVTVGADVSGRLIPLPGWLEPILPLSPLSSFLEVDTWALDDGSDVHLPGTDTPFGRQVGRIALLGIGEKLKAGKAGAVLDWFPIHLGAQVVSQNYLDPGDDSSRLPCHGDPLADTGRWRNGKTVGTQEDSLSPVKCFDTLPMDANGFGPGGGLRSDPMYRALRTRGRWFMGCDRPTARFPEGCGPGGTKWHVSR